MNLASCRDHEAAVTERVLLSLAVFLLMLTLAPSLAGPSSIRSDDRDSPPGPGGRGSADGQARPFEIQGHRGAKGLAPENSIAAFEKAIALGVDTLEMDAQSTSDRVLVVYHDQKIDGARCRGSASKLLKDLTLGEVKAIRCEGEVAIPTLEEVLLLAHAAPYPVRANVEIKMKNRSHGLPVGEFTALLVDVIDATGMRGRILVQSFDAEALRSMRRIAPDIPRAVLARNRGSYLAMVEDTTASVLLPRRDRLQREDVEALHARGVAVIPWVVDDPEEMRRLRSWGVDGIITNRPDVAIEFRDGPARGSTVTETSPPPPASWPPSPHAPTPSSAPPAQITAYSLDNVHKIAVIPFTSGDVVDSFGTSLFTQEFSRKHTRYELVDPVQMEVHVEGFRVMHSKSSINKLLAAARTVGAEALFIGQGFKHKAGFRWEVKLIEVNTGEMLWLSAQKQTSLPRGPEAKTKLMRKIVGSFPES